MRLKIYFIGKFKVRYDLGLIHRKGQNKARLEICFIEHEKTRYGCGFISLKILKYFTAKDLFHSKCWNKVRLWIYSIENSQNKAQLGIYSIEKAQIRYSWGQPRPQRIFSLQVKVPETLSSQSNKIWNQWDFNFFSLSTVYCEYSELYFIVITVYSELGKIWKCSVGLY